jgi:hypothetical protein
MAFKASLPICNRPVALTHTEMELASQEVDVRRSRIELDRKLVELHGLRSMVQASVIVALPSQRSRSPSMVSGRPTPPSPKLTGAQRNGHEASDGTDDRKQRLERAAAWLTAEQAQADSVHPWPGTPGREFEQLQGVSPLCGFGGFGGLGFRRSRSLCIW